MLNGKRTPIPSNTHPKYDHSDVTLKKKKKEWKRKINLEEMRLRNGEKVEPAFLGGKNAGVWFGGKNDLETLEFVISSSLLKFLQFYYSLCFLMFLLVHLNPLFLSSPQPYANERFLSPLPVLVLYILLLPHHHSTFL